MIWRGTHCYEVCPVCDKTVRLNKSLFGSMHLCLAKTEDPMIKRSVITYKDKNKSCGYIEIE